MCELRQHHPVTALLKAAALARSTFYYQLKLLAAGERRVELKEQIRAVFDRHKGRYGYRRITATLRHAGQIINHKTVQRLMGQMQLKSLVRPRYSTWSTSCRSRSWRYTRSIPRSAYCVIRSAMLEADQLLATAETQLARANSGPQRAKLRLDALQLRGVVSAALSGEGSVETRRIYERAMSMCRR